MENFIVSARKYRPTTFDSVVGQSHITTTLKNALKNHQLAQAFLFCGPRGVGKTTCARILAKTINCLNITPDFEACGQCESCTAFQKNGSMNIYELDAASNNSVDDIRNLVDQVRFPPQIGQRKVYIIDEVHMLSTSAFNAFLKTLEEPPSYVIFILATTEKHKIIPTILSRCQIFDFKRIEVRDMAEHLQNIAQKEHIQADYDALELIAQKADGGLRDALSLFDMLSTFSGGKSIQYQTALENLHVLDYDYYFRVTEALLAENIAEALSILDDILKRGFEGQNFVAGLIKHFRDLIVCQDAKTLKLLEVSERVKKQYNEQSQKAGLSFLLSALNLSVQCEQNYKSSKNPRFLIELCLMKIAHLNAAINWAKGTPAEEVKKKNLVDTQSDASKTEAKKQLGADNQSSSSKSNVSSFQKETPIKVSIPKMEDLEVSVKKELDQQQISESNQAFHEEDLRKGIEFYKSLHRNEGEVGKVFRQMPKIIDKNILEFTFNESEMLAFQKIEADFLDKIQKKLRNKSIEIRIQKAEDVQVKPYSNFQKYEYLSEKHPLLKDIKNRLGLELDL
ncbi:MAG: DNA polymerase III subunit gamma/tau [Microscillaceae bacterium]|nr:DNA polymerase III subunit gamma/tau [Microscillaceae bacterium]